MPPLPSCRIQSASIDATTHVRLKWKFEANFAFTEKYEFRSQPQYNPRDGGAWSFSIRGCSDRANEIVVDIHGGPLEESAIGNRISVKMQLQWLDGHQNAAVPLWSLRKPGRTLADSSDSTSKAQAHGASFTVKVDPSESCPQDLFRSPRRFRLSVTIEKKIEATPGGALGTSSHAYDRALRLTDLEHDLCLRFPSAPAGSTHLWANSRALKELSPYFDSLLSAGRVEAAPLAASTSGTPLRTPSRPASPVDEAVWDDSDDEIYVEPEERLVSAREGQLQSLTITEAAPATYRAVLLYLKSGYIAFAPLSSGLPAARPANSADKVQITSKAPAGSPAPSRETALPPIDYDSDGLDDTQWSDDDSSTDIPTSSRSAYLADYSKRYPTLPAPVSPKSVYRLAHILQLRELQTLALANLSAGINVQNVVAELQSRVASSYEDIRRMLTDFVVRNWDAVVVTNAWAHFHNKLIHGEIDARLVYAGLIERLILFPSPATK